MSLENKKRLREKYEPQLQAMSEEQVEARRYMAASISSFQAGEFLNTGKIYLRWKDRDWFEYIPDASQPFAFRRHTGEVITPGRMYTDGGSIPRWLAWKKGLSAWEFGPAYIVHDWEFDAHHCGLSNKTFEEVNTIMMEAVKTLMELPGWVRQPWVFRAIHMGISTSLARSIWDDDTGCTLPEEPSV